MNNPHPDEPRPCWVVIPGDEWAPGVIIDWRRDTRGCCGLVDFEALEGPYRGRYSHWRPAEDLRPRDLDDREPGPSDHLFF